MNPILSIRNVSKSFSGVKALDNVSMDFYPGEIHAIMGENGAGKSTLMKVLFGIYKRDSGEIIYNGEAVEFARVSDAIRQGIAMVQQEMSTLLNLSVAENVYLGREPRSPLTGIIDKEKMNRDVEAIFDIMGINDISPTSRACNLSIAQMQLVEIAKASSLNAKVLILDEATSSLTELEISKLFEMIKQFKNNGMAILYITHKMDEVFRLSDKITILRDGAVVGTYAAAEMNESLLVSKMVGREIKNVYPTEAYDPGEVILELQNFSRQGKNDNINLAVHRGEVLGMAGLVGAGRTELMESVFGLRKDYHGTTLIHGKRVTIRNPSDAISNGIALITEDRKKTGLNLLGSVRTNMSTVVLRKLCRSGLIQKKKEERLVNEQISALRIKTPSDAQIVSYLSGGNQQKVVISKWMLTYADIFIFDEPTRGVDVGAKYEIYLLINKLKAQGKAIVMISSEMPELIGMCDRLVVMHMGETKGFLDKKEMSQESIMTKAIS